MKKILIAIVCLVITISFAGCSIFAKSTTPNENSIKEICELTTCTYNYHGVVKMKKDKGDGFSHLFEKTKQYWLEYDGKVSVGIDLDDIDVDVDDTTVTIKLPEAKVLNVTVLPKSMKPYESEDGINRNDITTSEKAENVEKAEKNLREKFENDSTIMNQAENGAKELITNYINKIGKVTEVEYEIIWK